VSVTGSSIGMHNARNTDYILPYGIARFAAADAPESAAATCILASLYGNVSDPSHFLHAMDDRYLSHYAGHSILRAVITLSAAPHETGSVPPAPEVLLSRSGHYLRPRQAGERYAAIVSLRKGGILTAVGASGRVSDFGWIVNRQGRQFVNHWWSDAWEWAREGAVFTVRGRLAMHGEHLSAPCKHAALRLMSFSFGHRIIAPLKNALIFKKSPTGPQFERVLTFGADTIAVTDRISGLRCDDRILPAPRSSKRHVASADTAHEEDFELVRGMTVSRTENVANGVFEANTVYKFT
jgi:hypothetical protein